MADAEQSAAAALFRPLFRPMRVRNRQSLSAATHETNDNIGLLFENASSRPSEQTAPGTQARAPSSRDQQTLEELTRQLEESRALVQRMTTSLSDLTGGASEVFGALRGDHSSSLLDSLMLDISLARIK